MSFAVHSSSRSGSRARRRLLALVALAAVLSPTSVVDAASGAGVWGSSTKGLAIRGVTSVRVTAKAPEMWYASIYGPKKTRGVCESASKGLKPWVVKTTGLEEAVSERDSWRITLDPKDEKTIYAVSRGKIYKSVNAASSWEFAGNGTTTFSYGRDQNRSVVAGVEIDPSNSKRVLAGTLAKGFFGGIFESKDGAKTWTQIAGTGDRAELKQSGLGDNAWPIALDKSSDKYILVGGTSSSAWLSENRGATFKLTQPGGPGVHRGYALTPMVGREVFLAESRGLWRSRDAGETWGKAPMLAGTCIGVDIDPGARKIVYALIQGKGLFRTENLQTWTGPNHPEIDAHEVVCLPHQKNTILLSSRSTGLWISTDRGETVTPLVADIPEVTPAITHVAAHPANPSAWMAVSDAGAVFASADRGATWTKVASVGMPITRLVADPTSPAAWFVAASGVLRTTDGGAKWTQSYLPADPEERVVDLHRTGDGTWLALLEREARVVASRDGGNSWDKDALKRPTGTKSAWGAALAVDPKDSKHLLAALHTIAETWTKEDREGGPYESKDGGATWALLDAGFKSDKGVFRENWNRGSVCAIDPNHGTLFYGADRVGLFRLETSADGKPASWEESVLSGAPAEPSFNAFLMTPDLPDVVLSSTIVLQVEGLTTRATLQSVDGGKTFGALPDPGTRLASFSEDPGLPGRWLTGDPIGDRGVLSFDPSSGVPAIVGPKVPVSPQNPVAPVEVPKPPVDLVAFTGGKDKLVCGWLLQAGKAQDPANAAPAQTDEVLSLSLAGDMSRLFAGSADKSIYAYDGRTGAPKDRFLGQSAAIQCVVASADGKWVYAGDSAFSIHVWDAGVVGGKDLAKLDGHTGAVMALALSKDGTKLYSGSTDKSVRVWDTATRKELFAIPGHPGEVWAVALSPDGTRVYVGGRDASVRVYDAGSGAPVATWASSTASVSALIVSPEGSLLYAVGDGKELSVLGTGDGQPMFAYTGSAAALTCAALSADGEWIAAGAEDGLLRVWKKGRADVVWTSPKVHTAAIRCVALASEPIAKPPEPPPTVPPPPAMGDAPPAMGETPPPAVPSAPGMDGPPTPTPTPVPSTPGMDAPPAADPAPMPAPPVSPPGK